VLFWIADWVGVSFRRASLKSQQTDEENLSIVLGAVLTLLALIIGFTFSMAVSRYDQRKNYEEQEANAIGTEYVRLDVLPNADAVKARTLLRNYLDQRIVYYTSRDAIRLQQTRAETTRLQADLWSNVVARAAVLPPPITTFALAGMNDVQRLPGLIASRERPGCSCFPSQHFPTCCLATAHMPGVSSYPQPCPWFFPFLFS
jgi:hypothetical protein